MKVNVLGIEFDNLTLAEAVKAVEALFPAGGTVVTANPELILACRHDEALRRVVNGASLVTADGIGDLHAARILGTPLKERVPGSDLVPALLERASLRGDSVFLYGARPGVALRAGRNLKKAYPGLTVAGCENGYISDETPLWSELEKKRPAFLLLGLGAPRQERWMAQNAARLPGTVILGVGGFLDILAGDVRRAPVWMQRAGLEWLYRLGREPGRISRMAKLPGVLWLAVKERRKRSGI